MSQTAAQELGRRDGLAAAPPGVWRLAGYRIGMIVAALVCLGLVMTMSVEGGSARDFLPSVLHKLVWVALGAFSFTLGCTVNYQWWRRHSLGLLIVAFALLAIVLVPGIGTQTWSARRWIRFGPILGVQPSEFAKMALIIWLAAYCERWSGGRSEEQNELRQMRRGFVTPMAVAGMAALLVLVEPDLGTAVLMGAVCTGMLLACGTRPVYVVVSALAAVPVLVKLIASEPYRMRRITSFLDPWADPLDAGYQLVQSLIAIGSGGLLGKGLGCGGAGFLPAARNDFIFSAIAEQFGFLGALAVLAAFAWLVWEGLKVALRARDRFGFALALGLTGLIGLQALVHIAVVAGAVPTKGLTLPFVSAGGTSLVFSLWAAGILVNIARSEENPADFEVIPWEQDVPQYEHSLRARAQDMTAEIRQRLHTRPLTTNDPEGPTSGPQAP